MATVVALLCVTLGTAVIVSCGTRLIVWSAVWISSKFTPKLRKQTLPAFSLAKLVPWPSSVRHGQMQRRPSLERALCASLGGDLGPGGHRIWRRNSAIKIDINLEVRDKRNEPQSLADFPIKAIESCEHFLSITIWVPLI